MAKIAFLADIHAGVPGRLGDIIWSMRVAREYCKLANIDTVVVLGDLFHDRVSIDIEVIVAISNFFEETATKYDQKWIVFPGNHDMFLRHSWAVNSLVPLRKHLTVIEDLKILTVDDKRFWVLPFIQHERSFMRVLRKLDDRHEEGDVLLTHIGVRGATLNTCFLLKDWSVVTFDYSKFARVYTGHFHSKQSVGDKVYYPGSLIPFKFDEGDVPHGFYVYDLADGSHKFVNIWKAGAKFFPDERMPPQFCTFLDELLDNKTPEDVKGNIIRVMHNREYTLEEKRVVKDRLTELGAVSVRWMNIMQRIEKTEAEVLTTAAPNRNLWKAWIELDKKGLKDLDSSVLNQVHTDVVTEGDELYSAEMEDIE